ncbi:MAG: hypothetical protein KJ000_10355 [Pirellulaceae bacterium]|nr:hypothetical protein [Pirellulaceae bacterium]
MKRTWSCGAVLAATLVLISGIGLHAQPPAGGPGGGPGGPGGFGGFGGPGAFGGFGMGGLGGGDNLTLLLRADVRGELELLDEQVAELQKLADGMRDQFRDLMTPDENVSWQDRMQRFREVAEKARDEAQQKVDKILLPHQKKRLEQLSNQMRMPGGAMRGMTGGPLADELGLSDAQREKIRAKAEQLEAELRKKLAEMRAQAQAELLKELTPQQQAKIKEMFGEPFEFRRDEMPQVGRGGPGAQGGPAGRGDANQGGRGARPARGN